MSTSTKKIDDKYAKAEKKRADKLARELRNNALKDAKVTLDQGRTDLKTVGSEVDRVFANVDKDAKNQYDTARRQLETNNDEINTTLGSIHQGNMSANVNELNRLGLGNVGTLGSQQQADMNSLISSLQGQYNLDNLNLKQRDQDLTFDAQRQMGTDMVGQLGTDLENRYNTGLNEQNSSLRDTYLKNQYSLKDALARNKQSEEIRKKQQAAARHASQQRAAAYQRLQGAGTASSRGGSTYKNPTTANAEAYARGFDATTRNWSKAQKILFGNTVGGPFL